MRIAQVRRIASAALLGLFASQLLAQPALVNQQSADGRPLGLPKRVAYPSDLDVDLAFDGVQRLSSISTAGSQATFGYSGWGLTGSSIGPLTGTQTFDAAGRPELRTFTAASKKVFDEKSLYQAGGLLTGLLGMPPGTQYLPMTRLRVLRDFEIEMGPIAGVPEFRATGGAMQYFTGKTELIEDLINKRFLEVLP